MYVWGACGPPGAWRQARQPPPCAPRVSRCPPAPDPPWCPPGRCGSPALPRPPPGEGRCRAPAPARVAVVLGGAGSEPSWRHLFYPLGLNDLERGPVREVEANDGGARAAAIEARERVEALLAGGVPDPEVAGSAVGLDLLHRERRADGLWAKEPGHRRCEFSGARAALRGSQAWRGGERAPKWSRQTCCTDSGRPGRSCPRRAGLPQQSRGGVEASAVQSWADAAATHTRRHRVPAARTPRESSAGLGFERRDIPRRTSLRSTVSISHGWARRLFKCAW